ncbi:T9SS type A sorting domain-containing protein [Caldithrix abyssi]
MAAEIKAKEKALKYTNRYNKIPSFVFNGKNQWDMLPRGLKVPEEDKEILEAMETYAKTGRIMDLMRWRQLLKLRQALLFKLYIFSIAKRFRFFTKLGSIKNTFSVTSTVSRGPPQDRVNSKNLTGFKNLESLKTLFLILCLSFIMSGNSLFAQASFLQKVIDHKTLNPIEGAKVTYTLVEDNTKTYTQYTDSNGEAYFTDLYTPIIDMQDKQYFQKVNIEIYNILGQKVAVSTKRIDAQNTNVTDLWDGRNSKGQQTANGIYFLKVKSKNFQMIRKITYLKSAGIIGATKARIVKTNLQKTSGDKLYYVSITHDNYEKLSTNRIIHDGNNGSFTDSLERKTTYGKIGDLVFIEKSLVSNASITYILKSDTTKKWHKLTNTYGNALFDSLIVEVPESEYIVKIKPTEQSQQFIPKELTRTIREGDNGVVFNYVDPIPNEKIVAGTISKIIGEYDTQKYEGYAKATINIIRKGEEEPFKTTNTNSKGEYNLGYIPAGEYKLEIIANDTTYFNRGTNERSIDMKLTVTDRKTLSDSIHTGRKNAVLIKKMQWVPGTTADSINFGIWKNYSMMREVRIRGPPTVAGWTEINTNGTKIYLKNMREYEKQRLKEIMAEADSLFFGNRINPWIFTNEEIDEDNLGNNYLTGNYDKLGWNIIRGESITSDEIKTSLLTGDRIIVGGRVSLDPEGRKSVFKEMYGRIPGFADTIQESYMNPSADEPTLRDRAMFSMFYKLNKAMGTDRKEDWTFETIIMP